MRDDAVDAGTNGPCRSFPFAMQRFAVLRLVPIEDRVWIGSITVKIADAGKISVWRIGVEQDQAAVARRESGQELTNEYLAVLSRDRISYYLAAFLVGAQDYAYLQYGWGWDLHTGPLCPQPELQRPLGKPLGEAVRESPDGWVYRRQFEHADVTVDLEKREGNVVLKARTC